MAGLLKELLLQGVCVVQDVLVLGAQEAGVALVRTELSQGVDQGHLSSIDIRSEFIRNDATRGGGWMICHFSNI